ncbi:hypothetical protein ACFL0H_08860 [Thermodesulfobacteriota bacterium]
MLSKEVERILILLEKIERTMSNIYGSLAVNQSFTDEVRRFWATMMEAELEHAALFRNIKNQAKLNEAIEFELNFNIDYLLKTYQKIQKVEEIVRDSKLSERKAYTIGAKLEEDLYEFSYCKRIKSNDGNIMKEISRVDNDTKHHYLQLHNYSMNSSKFSINQ